MLGWSISASACRSASKRAMTCRVSMPGLMTLSATLRRTGSVCSAMKTTPMPAFADLLQELVRPDLRAGPFERAAKSRSPAATAGALEKLASTSCTA